MQFIQYTFKPSFGALLALMNALFVVGFATFYYIDHPVYFTMLLILWVALMLAIACGSWLRYRAFIDSRPREHRWNDRTRRLENTILNAPYRQK